MGKETPEAVKTYLQQHAGEFDAVAVFVDDHYAQIRTALEGNFSGPKILVSYVAGRFDPPDVRQALSEKRYISRITLGEPSAFESEIKKNFENL